MKHKHYLILLTETERSMVEEALTHFIQNPFLGDGAWVNVAVREKAREDSVKLLEIIKGFDGGIRKVMSEAHLYYIKESLVWYGNFIPGNEEFSLNEYKKLGCVIPSRDEHRDLFNFDPNNYNPKEKKEIRKKDFSETRYLVAREVKGKIDYISEIISKENEPTDKYEVRANQVLASKSGNYKGKWLLIKSDDLGSLKLSKDCRYFCNS